MRNSPLEFNSPDEDQVEGQELADKVGGHRSDQGQQDEEGLHRIQRSGARMGPQPPAPRETRFRQKENRLGPGRGWPLLLTPAPPLSR